MKIVQFQNRVIYNQIYTILPSLYCKDQLLVSFQNLFGLFLPPTTNALSCRLTIYNFSVMFSDVTPWAFANLAKPSTGKKKKPRSRMKLFSELPAKKNSRLLIIFKVIASLITISPAITTTQSENFGTGFCFVAHCLKFRHKKVVMIRDFVVLYLHNS